MLKRLLAFGMAFFLSLQPLSVMGEELAKKPAVSESEEEAEEEETGEETEEESSEEEAGDLSARSASAVVRGTPVDFVFVIDSTASMQPYIDSVRSNINSFMDYLAENEIAINCAVIDYKDITHDGASSTRIHAMDGEMVSGNWTTDSSLIRSELKNIKVKGGGDLPETPTDAFAKVIDGDLSFHADTQKFIFLLTDDSFKDESDDSRIRSMDTCAELFRLNNVHVSVVGKMKFEPDYEGLYRMTGGKYIDIESKDYYKVMIDIADWVVEESQDTDGDGLPDEWETEGVDYNHDGVIDLDLAALGADPNVKDVFVEVDWMYRPEQKGSFLWMDYTKISERNLHPSEEAMRMVYEQFREHDINLHIDAGPDSVDYVTGRRWGDASGGNRLPYSDNFELGSYYENWNDMAMEHFSRARWNVFHYAMFINKFNGSRVSGLAENIPGQFFLVADVDGWISKTTTATAGTFMHELGHTLGLHHGGSDDIVDKPNNLSIMNYLFQTSGLAGTNEVNYSEYVLPELDEENLNENDGIDPEGVTEGSGLGTKWYYTKEKKFLFWDTGTTEEEGSVDGVARRSIDFNMNGTMEDNVSVDLNSDRNTLLGPSVNDWNMMQFKGALIGGYGKELEEGEEDSDSFVLIEHDETMDEALTEIDYETAQELGVLANPGSCAIEAVNPGRLYSNIEDQQIFVTVKNLGNAPTSAILTVTCELLKENAAKKVKLEAEGDSKDTVTIELPVKELPDSGTYEIFCELECESGTRETYRGELEILSAHTLEVKVGERVKILPDEEIEEEYSWESTNKEISVDAGGTVVAKKAGEGVIIGTTETGDKYVCQVTAAEEEEKEEETKPEEKEDPKEKDPKPEEKEKEDPKKEDPKKEDPKKEDPKKEDPKKEDSKKEDSKKEDPKKEDPKKEDTNKDNSESMNTNTGGTSSGHKDLNTGSSTGTETQTESAAITSSEAMTDTDSKPKAEEGQGKPVFVDGEEIPGKITVDPDIKPEPVFTGDTAKTLIWFGIAACAVLCAVLLLIIRKKMMK